MTNVYCGTVLVTHKSYESTSRNQSDILVFKIRISSYYHCISTLKSYLDEGELHRAERFHFEKDRNRFIICRALLKIVLARHTHTGVTAISIGIDSNKKPYLISDASVHFNLSHTEDLALIVLNHTQIGIDIELLKRDYDFVNVLSHVYSKREIERVLHSKNQLYTFYKYWTRKEAIVKATGEGISDYLIQIPANNGHHQVDSYMLSGLKSVTVFSFDIDKEHVASIAVDNYPNTIENLTIYSLPESIEGLEVFRDL